MSGDSFMLTFAKRIPKVSDEGWRPSESPVKRAYEKSKNLGYDSLMATHYRNNKPVTPYRDRGITGGGGTSATPKMGMDAFMHTHASKRSPRVTGPSERHGHKVNLTGRTNADGTAITREEKKLDFTPSSSEDWRKGQKAIESVLAGKPLQPDRAAAAPAAPAPSSFRAKPPLKATPSSDNTVALGALAVQAAAKAAPSERSARGTGFSMEMVEHVAANEITFDAQAAEGAAKAGAASAKEAAERTRTSALAQAEEECVLAEALLRQGNVHEAEPLLASALTQRTTLLGADHDDTRAAQALVDRMEAMKRELAAATDLLRQAIEKVKGAAPAGCDHAMLNGMFATLQKLAEDSGGADEVRNVVREKLVHGLVQRAVANVATGNLGAPAPSSAANNLLSCFAPAWASSDASQTGGWLWW